MGRLIVTLLVLCLISPTTTCAAARREYDLRRGLERAMRGHLLADGATAPGGAVVPFHWSPELYNVANFTIGTPPQPASAFIDLAGEAIWTQCSQCTHCFKQDLPVFVPNVSSTFKPEPCGTDVCKSIPTSKCASNVCTYDGTTVRGHTVGIVATDTFAIGTATPASLGFGCVVASDIDTMGGPSGFIGLGRTPWSLVAQMKLTRFSYCLAPYDTGKNSRLFLGASAKLAGGGAWTPFVKTSPNDEMSKYYPVELEEIKAGDATITMPQGRNTVLVQTAVMRVSLLVDSVYQDFKKAVMASVGAAPTATPVEPFEVCFPKAGVSGAPDLVFKFQAGAALTVPPANYLFDAGNDTVCLSVMSIALLNMTAFDRLNILGSFQQENTCGTAHCEFFPTSNRNCSGDVRLFLGAATKLAGGSKSAMTTPFVKSSPDDIKSLYYLIRLEGIKAGDEAITVPQSGSTVLLQTFSPVSFLVDGVYQDLKKAVTAAVGGPTATPPEQFQPLFDLCFKRAGVSRAPDVVLSVAHVPRRRRVDGAAVELSARRRGRHGVLGGRELGEAELDGGGRDEHPGRLAAAELATLLVLCLIPPTMCSLAAAHDLRRGLEQATRGRLLADATPAGGAAVVPIRWSPPYYVANFTIGTPPQPASAIVDVAGELVWTQCSACSRCFKQDLPLFVTNASSTFRAEPCGTAVCDSIPTRNCSGNVCFYQGPTTQLGGNTFGFAATDTFAIGTATARLGFGCVVASDIDTMDGPSGFIGLGRTPWSLVAQMKLTRFSYCLAPQDTGKKSSRLFLGSSAKLAGGESTSTAPFIKTSPNDDSSNYYLLSLEAIKAGNTTIATAQSGGTLVMHTVSPFSLLVDSAYKAFKKAVTEAVGGAAPMATPPQPFDLCFKKAAGFSSASAPDLVFTFQQGAGAAALTVPPTKYLIDVGEEKDTACVAILSMAWLNKTGLEGVSVLGSLQQENVHFLYDLKKETLSFEAADCSSLP
uniref:Peptidase A1 domain-containing protein n=1 Tax=Oryza rufipogon TaxID=4529 RepID=A0A0E0R1V9_ORYRU